MQLTKEEHDFLLSVLTTMLPNAVVKLSEAEAALRLTNSIVEKLKCEVPTV